VGGNYASKYGMSLLRASHFRSGIPAIYIVPKDTVKLSRK